MDVLIFTSFHVSRETYFYTQNSCGYEIEKESPQTLVVFQFIASIVLYQKLLFESRRDEFNFDIIIYAFNTGLKWIFLSSLLFNVSRETFLYISSDYDI